MYIQIWDCKMVDWHFCILLVKKHKHTPGGSDINVLNGNTEKQIRLCRKHLKEPVKFRKNDLNRWNQDELIPEGGEQKSMEVAVLFNGHVQLPVEPVNCFRSDRMNCEVYRTFCTIGLDPTKNYKLIAQNFT